MGTQIITKRYAVLPQWECYVKSYTSMNYGINALRFVFDNGDSYYFSYETLIAFRTQKTGLIIRKNEWGTTTGKHLNAINRNKSLRVDAEEFQKRYNETFNPKEATN